jgi:CRISPR-associated protein Cas5t
VIRLRVEVPYASFRKSFARSYAETYPLPPPATIYGMLLSLVGERFRAAHEGVRIALAFQSVPRVATTLRKLSRYKYGVGSRQSSGGNVPDFVETLCGIVFLCWIDSSAEQRESGRLEDRVLRALESPESIDRYGLLSLGMSDDMVDDLRLSTDSGGAWLRLRPVDSGSIELPVWVAHVGALGTRWQRYELDEEVQLLRNFPGPSGWTSMHSIVP